MRNDTSDGAGTLLSRTEPVKQKSRKSSPARKPVPATAEPSTQTKPPFSTVADHVFLDRKWPRHYRLPGLVAYRDFTAEEILDQVCIVIHRYEDDFHDLVARLARKHPAEAAELAEVLAIVEQTLCAGGAYTELDDTPAHGLSPRLRLNALAMVQALNKRRRQEIAGKQEGGQH